MLTSVLLCLQAATSPFEISLCCCRAFTLVGDHYQLPPLVTSRAAEEGGLGISLFKLLCDKHPQVKAAVVYAQSGRLK